MDYSQLSDFEINKRVGSALGKELMPDDCQDLGLSGFSEVMLTNGDFKDYCNDPADAWQIIRGNRIGIIPAPCPGEWKAAHRDVGEDGTPRHFTRHINPLRAAMIVFLMMQESQNA
ncbi:DUF2591 family protein [Cronobacter dublinensis]|nr:DUF2591 family protein [Cronobacter dublinensis]